MSDLQGVDEAALRVPLRSMPAPRVAISGTATGQTVEPILDETMNLEDFRSRYLAAFGTTEQIIAEALFQQIVNALHPDPKKPLDAATANLALALLYRVGPRDEIEAMLGCQMIVAHVAALDASRRALHVEQTPGGRQAYLSLARKLMTLYTAQMDALNRYRGKATVQRVVVERVYVAPGAQAIVGAVANGGRGDGGMGDNPSDQPRRPFWLRGLEAARNADRCGAKTRRGTVCQSPAMPNGRCRIHGGRSPGAPRGERNGRWRGGSTQSPAPWQPLLRSPATSPGSGLASELWCCVSRPIGSKRVSP